MEQILINGIAADYVSATDRGLHYGDGIFETIACIGGQPVFLAQHLHRMAQGAHRLDISFPGEQLFRGDIGRLLAGRQGDSVIKLMLTRGPGQRGYRCDTRQTPTRLSMLSDWPAHISRWRQQGINARFCKTPVSTNPALQGIKSLNRLENVLASNELGADADEGFMSNTDGHIIEGTMSNIFAIMDATLVTPDLSQGGIEGIMREQIIALAADNNIKLQIRPIDREELLLSRELFVCNSLIGICPVRQIEQQAFETGTMTDTINELLQRRIDADAKAAA